MIPLNVIRVRVSFPLLFLFRIIMAIGRDKTFLQTYYYYHHHRHVPACKSSARSSQTVPEVQEPGHVFFPAGNRTFSDDLLRPSKSRAVRTVTKYDNCRVARRVFKYSQDDRAVEKLGTSVLDTAPVCTVHGIKEDQVRRVGDKTFSNIAKFTKRRRRNRSSVALASKRVSDIFQTDVTTVRVVRRLECCECAVFN